LGLHKEKLTNFYGNLVTIFILTCWQRDYGDNRHYLPSVKTCTYSYFRSLQISVSLHPSKKALETYCYTHRL